MCFILFANRFLNLFYCFYSVEKRFYFIENLVEQPELLVNRIKHMNSVIVPFLKIKNLQMKNVFFVFGMQCLFEMELFMCLKTIDKK